MARPSKSFNDLPQNWQDWLRRVENADTKWRRREREREELLARLERKNGVTGKTLRNLPEAKEAWQGVETARIERAELLLAATEDGVSTYRLAKHLGYPTQHAVASAIQSLKGERVDYRKKA